MGSDDEFVADVPHALSKTKVDNKPVKIIALIHFVYNIFTPTTFYKVYFTKTQDLWVDQTRDLNLDCGNRH